jgi:hypothetical protein
MPRAFATATACCACATPAARPPFHGLGAFLDEQDDLDRGGEQFIALGLEQVLPVGVVYRQAGDVPARPLRAVRLDGVGAGVWLERVVESFGHGGPPLNGCGCARDPRSAGAGADGRQLARHLPHILASSRAAKTPQRQQ